MAAAAILDFTAFRYSDFGRFLVCYSPHKIVPETVEKPFLAIFLRVKPYIYLTNSVVSGGKLLRGRFTESVVCCSVLQNDSENK